MGQMEELRWGRTATSHIRHGIHPDYDPAADELVGLCGTTLAEVGPIDETWDYDAEDACQRCREKRGELVLSEF